MNQIYEAIKRLFHEKAFVTFGTFSGVTMGTILFGGTGTLHLFEYAIKLVATIVTGFAGGCAGQYGKHVADYFKSKYNGKRQKKSNDRRRDDKAA